MTQRSRTLLFLRTRRSKAIRLPSGDQTGRKSPPRDGVSNSVCSVPSDRTLSIPACFTKAMKSLVGDHAGSKATESGVNWCRLFPSASMIWIVYQGLGVPATTVSIARANTRRDPSGDHDGDVLE